MKNTWNNSKIDPIVAALKQHGENNVIVMSMGRVKARGENDRLENREYYSIRKLYHNDIVIIEQMIRDPDPDCSDILTSTAFKRNKQPMNWDLEVTFSENCQKQVPEIDVDDFWGDYTSGLDGE